MKKTLKFTEIDCANCAAKVEKNISKLDGIESVRVVFLTQKIILEVEKPDIRVLVNCAGFGKFGSHKDIAVKDSLLMVDLNSRAPVALTEYALPYMQEGTRVLQICSTASFHPVP